MEKSEQEKREARREINRKYNEKRKALKVDKAVLDKKDEEIRLLSTELNTCKENMKLLKSIIEKCIVVKKVHSSDIYLEFITEKIKRVENHEEARMSFMKLSHVYLVFTEWYTQNYPLEEKIERSTLQDELIRRLGFIRDKDEIYGHGKNSNGSFGWQGYFLI